MRNLRHYLDQPTSTLHIPIMPIIPMPSPVYPRFWRGGPAQSAATIIRPATQQPRAVCEQLVGSLHLGCIGLVLNGLKPRQTASDWLARMIKTCYPRSSAAGLRRQKQAFQPVQAHIDRHFHSMPFHRGLNGLFLIKTEFNGSDT